MKKQVSCLWQHFCAANANATRCKNSLVSHIQKTNAFGNKKTVSSNQTRIFVKKYIHIKPLQYKIKVNLILKTQAILFLYFFKGRYLCYRHAYFVLCRIKPKGLFYLNAFWLWYQNKIYTYKDFEALAKRFIFALPEAATMSNS